MNFQITPVLSPLRVLIVNPLVAATRMMTVRVLCGYIFGDDQPIDLILLVYSNEREKAEIYRKELLGCAFAVMNSITVSSDLPNLSDADVFMFMGTLKNPNNLDYENIDDDQFDALYLIIKIANNLRRPLDVEGEQEEKPEKIKHRFKEAPEKPRKPIIVANGLITMCILYNFSHNLPSDMFFCPTPLSGIARSLLGDYLKIRCNELNNVLVWAADDEVFHVEFERPIVVRDNKLTGDRCEWPGASKEYLESLNLDHVQFNESWLRKEFMEKVHALAVKNPYGPICKAVKYSRAVKSIWQTRSNKNLKEWRSCLGVISDGSLGTIKGCAYVLPLIFVKETWSVNHALYELSHVRQEINRINERVRKQHTKLMRYCKKFLKDNILNQAFIPKDDESGSQFSMPSSRHSDIVSQ